MGHRALIAYERPDGLYNCHYSHWGGLHLRLKREISPKTPFGGDDDSEWAQAVFTQLLEDAPDPDFEGYCTTEKRLTTTVDLVPRARALPLEEIITEQLDYLHHEAFYVVDQNFQVTAFRTLWFGLHYEAKTVDDSPTIGNGALRTVSWYDDEPVGDGYVIGEFEGLKAVVADLIDRGIFTHEEGLEYMEDRLWEWTSDREDLLIRTPELNAQPQRS